MKRWVLPAAVIGGFVGLVALLAVGLHRDPRLVPSPLIGKPAPQFSLSTLKDPNVQFTQADLKGGLSLLNVWATWCVSCRQEHPVLMEIARRGEVPIYGLNYKDDRQAALRWLSQLGDPYVANIFDPDGRLGLEFGVYGTPETFIVDQRGHIAYKHVGPVSPAVWNEKLLPVLRQLRDSAG